MKSAYENHEKVSDIAIEKSCQLILKELEKRYDLYYKIYLQWFNSLEAIAKEGDSKFPISESHFQYRSDSNETIERKFPIP